MGRRREEREKEGFCVCERVGEARIMNGLPARGEEQKCIKKGMDWSWSGPPTHSDAEMQYGGGEEEKERKGRDDDDPGREGDFY